jgi:hypothetical protein
MRKPLLVLVLVMLMGGSAFAVWNFYNGPPHWIAQTADQLEEQDEYPHLIVAKATATSTHHRMALDKARLKAISSLIRKLQEPREGFTIEKTKGDSGTVKKSTFSGSMSDFKELDSYVEKTPQGEYKAYFLIGITQ